MPLKSLAEYKTRLSNNLKYLLDTYSMNILELSSKLELSYAPIYNILIGRANPTLDTLLKVANYFNITVSQLTGDIPIEKVNSANYSQIIPVLQWSEVTKYFYNQNCITQDHKQLLISSEYIIPKSAFALYANEKAEPLFKIGTILIFDKITTSIKNYDNTYVLVLSDSSFLAIKKIFIEENIIYIQSINTNIPPQPFLDTGRVIAHLIQTRYDFYSFL